ncbi:hypothetical protein PMAYCL1PPCAC_05216, partial [Pristionchus mayeri]
VARSLPHPFSLYLFIVDNPRSDLFATRFWKNVRMRVIGFILIMIVANLFKKYSETVTFVHKLNVVATGMIKLSCQKTYCSFR